MCYPGDDQYAAAAAATGTRNGEPVYWFDECRTNPQPDDEVWVDLVAAAQDSESRSRERERHQTQLRNALEGLDDLEEVERLGRTRQRQTREGVRVGDENKVEDVVEDEGEGERKGKEGEIEGEEINVMEREEEINRRDSAMAAYKRDMDEAVARAMEPAFTDDFAEALKRLGFEE